jgi:hypothetical protein
VYQTASRWHLYCVSRAHRFNRLAGGQLYRSFCAFEGRTCMCRPHPHVETNGNEGNRLPSGTGTSVVGRMIAVLHRHRSLGIGLQSRWGAGRRRCRHDMGGPWTERWIIVANRMPSGGKPNAADLRHLKRWLRSVPGCKFKSSRIAGCQAWRRCARVSLGGSVLNSAPHKPGSREKEAKRHGDNKAESEAAGSNRRAGSD